MNPNEPPLPFKHLLALVWSFAVGVACASFLWWQFTDSANHVLDPAHLKPTPPCQPTA